jgi:hypothetical protein
VDPISFEEEEANDAEGMGEVALTKSRLSDMVPFMSTPELSPREKLDPF